MNILSLKSRILLILAAGVFLFGNWVLAEESDTDGRSVRENVQEKRQEVRINVQDKRQEFQVKVQETKEEIKLRAREATEAFRQETEQRKEELKTRVEQKRKEIKIKIETKREELKQRLEKIKNERKKQAVERIDKRMDELNERLLGHYLNVLGKLGNVLVRISERADRAEERGIDVVPVRTAIDAANSAITAARLAIEAQSGKTYTIQIGTEDGLKTDVGRARQALHDDLVAVRLVVKTAHEAVRQAATTLAQLPKPTLIPEATESSTPEPIENE